MNNLVGTYLNLIKWAFIWFINAVPWKTIISVPLVIALIPWINKIWEKKRIKEQLRNEIYDNVMVLLTGFPLTNTDIIASFILLENTTLLKEKFFQANLKEITTLNGKYVSAIKSLYEIVEITKVRANECKVTLQKIRENTSISENEVKEKITPLCTFLLQIESSIKEKLLTIGFSKQKIEILYSEAASLKKKNRIGVLRILIPKIFIWGGDPPWLKGYVPEQDWDEFNNST